MFKVGDKVKVIGNDAAGLHHGFEIGDEVVIVEIFHSNSFGMCCKCERDGCRYTQYILPCDLELVKNNGYSSEDYKHYNKSILGKDGIITTVDVYRVLEAFSVTNPQLQHIVKKALCAGQRGHKDYLRDLQDVVDSAKNAIEMEKQMDKCNA